MMYHLAKGIMVFGVAITSMGLCKGYVSSLHIFPEINTMTTLQTFKFRAIFLNEDIIILAKYLLNYFLCDPIDGKSALVQQMVWHWTGNKLLCKATWTSFTDAYMQHQTKECIQEAIFIQRYQ